MFELNSSQGPEVGLKLFSNVPNFRVLVCGGDGTVAWVLDVIEQFNFESPPPVSILPLGTGNDLSRVLQWGGGFSKVDGPGLSNSLHEVNHAAVTMVDRWKVNIKEENLSDNSDRLRSKFMMNYLGNTVTERLLIFVVPYLLFSNSKLLLVNSQVLDVMPRLHMNFM